MIDKIKKLDPTILVADGFDDCIIGLTFREDELVALYSADRIIDKLARDMTEAEAAEYFGYNIEGAYVGVKTPMYIWGDYDALED
jgi:hypothetical protein